MSGECGKCSEHCLDCKCGIGCDPPGSKIKRGLSRPIESLPIPESLSRRHENDNKYGSAPLIFFDDEKRKEWENLDPAIRNNIFSLLHSAADKMETKLCLQILCNVIIDMDKRIQDLEKKNEL